MFQALALSIGQLMDAPVLRVFLKSLLLTVAILVALGGLLWFGANWIEATLVPKGSWFEGVLGTMGVLAGIAAAWFLFRALAVATVGLFADEVVQAVEARHYPKAAAGAASISFGRSLRLSLGSIGRVLATNVVIAPLYVLLLVTGIGSFILFFVVNAWLLGRDLADMAGSRHLGDAELAEWRNKTRLQRFAMGAIGTGLLLVPIVNLVAPVLGAAMATHLFHRKARA